MYASGLTNVTDLAFATDGTLYAVQISSAGLLADDIGALVRVTPGASQHQTVLGGLTAPYGVAAARQQRLRQHVRHLRGRRGGPQDQSPLTQCAPARRRRATAWMGSLEARAVPCPSTVRGGGRGRRGWRGWVGCTVLERPGLGGPDVRGSLWSGVSEQRRVASGRTSTAEVLVVGGGPVGLTLAMDLASRGVDVVVAELRHPAEAPNVKCNHVSARSMEIFRRLGVAAALRDAGLPADHPNDVAFRTTFLGHELGRIPIPARRDRYTARDGPDTWWPTPEPPHRINQMYMEPVLFHHAAATPGLRILNRTAVESFTETTDGVTATARHLDGGAASTSSAAFLVGCDGGRSDVRRQLGIALRGDAVVQRVQSSFCGRRGC